MKAVARQASEVVLLLAACAIGVSCGDEGSQGVPPEPLAEGISQTDAAPPLAVSTCSPAFASPDAGSYAILGPTGGVVGTSTLTNAGPLALAGEVESELVPYKTVPVAGPSAVHSSGTLLMIGGPTMEVAAILNPGSETMTALKLEEAELSQGFDFGWWEFGAPAVAADGSFLLPAIWNQTPPDRSVNEAQAYVAAVSPDGEIVSLRKLMTEPLRDKRIFAAATTTAVLVADSGGDLRLYALDGELDQTLRGVGGDGSVVGIGQRGNGIVELRIADELGESTERACFAASG